ncbi:MAG: hypothetical protein OEL76_00670 [Siculibacillus sp.]|nr:hypothetical protein [Siculibacillus sp.]
MIFGWLNRKAEESQRREADRFLVSLQGADATVIDGVLGMAMYWAAIYKKNGIDLYQMEDWIGRSILFPMEIGKQVRIQQKQNTLSSATGLMVWLFSSRSLLYPELRLGGRQIWMQLGRATLLSEQIALDCCAAMGLDSTFIDRLRVPNGLEALSN